MKTSSAKDRLLAGVIKVNDCWVWAKAHNPQGYGTIRVAGVVTRAHRAAYELFIAPIPPGLWVLHRCDDPRCVNPGHLFLGTAKDNAQDRSAKKRHANRKGGAHPMAKIYPAFVPFICSAKNLTGSELADLFSVSAATISLIKNNLRWNHT